MNSNYQEERGYAHWRSAKFMRELEFSLRVFDKIVFGNHFLYPRPVGGPNTPADLSDSESETDSDDGYEGICGPDEDYYIIMAEGQLIGYWPYTWYGYWPEGVDDLDICGFRFENINIGFSKPRRDN